MTMRTCGPICCDGCVNRFDTAFHRTPPRRKQLLPQPYKRSDHGGRRYGFHGLSYKHPATRVRMSVACCRSYDLPGVAG